jgi:eukaryotic-like serine/threonine-protein kinase
MSQSLPANLKVIGRYTILRELRRDRHSVSYAAVDPVMNRELVVKAVQIVPPGPPIRAEARRRIEQAFVRQAQAAGRLHHPNIVTVFDAGLGHEFGYLVIERVAGRPLQELLASGAQFTDLQCAGIGARVADALEYAHGQGLAHGHLGPQHVLIQSDGSPKITGFGGWIDGGTGGDEALNRTDELLPFFQNEITDETRGRDLRSVASLLCTMIQGRTHAVDVALPAIPGAAPLPADRPSAPNAFSQLLSDTLDPQSPSAPRSAAALRDGLIAFVWAERSKRPGTSALGVSLSASLSPTLSGAATARAPAEGVSAGPQERPDLTQLAVERLAESLATARARFARAGPWARRHRLALGLAATVLVTGVVLGNLLGQIRSTPRAAAPLAATGASDPSAAAPSTHALASGTVVFRIQPWGEILIDDKPTGVAPPLQQVSLPAGHHKFEVRHLDDPVWPKDLDVAAGASVTLEHEFK